MSRALRDKGIVATSEYELMSMSASSSDVAASVLSCSAKRRLPGDGNVKSKKFGRVGNSADDPPPERKKRLTNPPKGPAPRVTTRSSSAPSSIGGGTRMKEAE